LRISPPVTISHPIMNNYSPAIDNPYVDDTIEPAQRRDIIETTPSDGG
jgi:hypothetical protein